MNLANPTSLDPVRQRRADKRSAGARRGRHSMTQTGSLREPFVVFDAEPTTATGEQRSSRAVSPLDTSAVIT